MHKQIDKTIRVACVINNTILQVILAEDNEIRDILADHDLHVQTVAEVAPIEVSNKYFTFSFSNAIL